jgi:hypothetical protein
MNSPFDFFHILREEIHFASQISVLVIKDLHMCPVVAMIYISFWMISQWGLIFKPWLREAG